MGVEDLKVQLDFKFHFHNHVGHITAQALKCYTSLVTLHHPLLPVMLLLLCVLLLHTIILTLLLLSGILCH